MKKYKFSFDAIGLKEEEVMEFDDAFTKEDIQSEFESWCWQFIDDQVSYEEIAEEE